MSILGRLCETSWGVAGLSGAAFIFHEHQAEPQWRLATRRGRRTSVAFSYTTKV